MPRILSALAARIRSATDATGALHELRRFVDESEGLRVVLYANAGDLSDLLGQRRNNVSEVLSSGDITTEIGAGYLSFVSGKVSGKTSMSEKVEMTPLIKALLLEETEKYRGLLVDLSSEPPRPGRLLWHVGRSWLFGPWSERLVNSDMERVVGPEALAELEGARAQQAKKLAWGKPNHPGTLVWLARESLPLAAIGTYENADGNSFPSYELHPPFGFLGLLEAELQSCVLLKPLAIWHQSAQPTA